MKFGPFFNFLSKTRIILTPEPECSSLTHMHDTSLSPLQQPISSLWEQLGAADLVVTVLLRTFQPFPKSRWPFVWGPHIPLGSVRNISTKWTLLSTRRYTLPAPPAPPPAALSRVWYRYVIPIGTLRERLLIVSLSWRHLHPWRLTSRPFYVELCMSTHIPCHFYL